MRKPKPVPASELSLGNYLRWLADTMTGEPSVAEELLLRAEQADALHDIAAGFVQSFSKSGEFNTYSAELSPAELHKHARDAIKKRRH